MGSSASCRAGLRPMWDSGMVEGAAWGQRAGPRGRQPQPSVGSYLPFTKWG